MKNNNKINKRAKIIAVVNYKGGVAKTTTTTNIAAILAEEGKKVLMIDSDPRGSLSNRTYNKNAECVGGLAVNSPGIKGTEANVLYINKNELPVPYETEFENLDIIPTNAEQALVEEQIINSLMKCRCDEEKITKELGVFKENIKKLEGKYDYIMIDCPASFPYINTVNILASDEIILPTIPSSSSIDGLIETIDEVKSLQKRNSKIIIKGIVITIKENTKADNEGIDEIKKTGIDILGEIRKNTTLRASEKFNQPINYYDKKSLGYEDYSKLVRRLKE